MIYSMQGGVTKVIIVLDFNKPFGYVKACETWLFIFIYNAVLKKKSYNKILN